MCICICTYIYIHVCVYIKNMYVYIRTPVSWPVIWPTSQHLPRAKSAVCAIVGKLHQTSWRIWKASSGAPL